MKAKEFWAALHDHSLTNYLDAVVLLEVVIENRKAILKQGEIPSLDDAVKLLTTARGEFREVARLSNYTKNNIKKQMQEIIRKKSKLPEEKNSDNML